MPDLKHTKCFPLEELERNSVSQISQNLLIEVTAGKENSLTGHSFLTI